MTSRKSSENGQAAAADLGAFAGSSVPFVLQTAIERATSGKRQIRPKIIHEEGLIGLDESDEDDPDFDLGKSKGKGHKRRSLDLGSSDDEDSDDDTNSSISSGTDSNNQNNNSGDSDSDSGSDISKSHSDDSDSEDGDHSRSSSSLRETLRKLNQDIPVPIEYAQNKRKTKKGKAKTKAKPKKKTVKVPVKRKKPPAKQIPKKNPPSKSKSKKSTTVKSPSSTILGKVHKTMSQIKATRHDIDLHRKICSVCLGERSDDSNEIIECDSCAQTVHEGCYGVSDNVSISSGESDSITEPWFCDYCKNPNAGTGGIPGSDVPNRLMCSVCPNSDGLLKETVQETFIHLVCALYIPGVISPIDGKLSIAKIPALSWGAKPCIFCPDSKDAYTGVTIKCDAGMCKSQFHPTCAQKLGLLSESTESEVADPYFANCKIHGVKEVAKNRAKLYKILQEQIRIRREKRSCPQIIDPQEQTTYDRTRRKLSKIRNNLSARRESQLMRETKPVKSESGILPCNSQCPVYPQLYECPKLFRKVETSFSYYNTITHRLELQGENPKAINLEDYNEKIIRNIKKRWNVQPNFNIEFIAYYFDRESRIRTFTQQNESLYKENLNLGDRQQALSTKLEFDVIEQMELTDSTVAKNGQWSILKNSLLCVSSDNDKPKLLEGLQKLEAAIPGGQVSRSTKSPPRKTPTKTHLRRTGSTRLTLSKCSVCHETSRQHLITRCDKCKRHYHLGCLDPPLTRMPKRTKLVGWACSDCNENENSTEETAKINTQAPRALRKSVKKPEKYRESFDSSPEVAVPHAHSNTNLMVSPANTSTTASSVTKKQKQIASLWAKDYKLVPCEVRVQPMKPNFSPVASPTKSPAPVVVTTNGVLKKSKAPKPRKLNPISKTISQQGKRSVASTSQIPKPKKERKPRTPKAEKKITKPRAISLVSKAKSKQDKKAKLSTSPKEKSNKSITSSPVVPNESSILENKAETHVSDSLSSPNPPLKLKGSNPRKPCKKVSVTPNEGKTKKPRAKSGPRVLKKRKISSDDVNSSIEATKRSRRISGQPPAKDETDNTIPENQSPKLNGNPSLKAEVKQNGISSLENTIKVKTPKRAKRPKLPSSPQETNFNKLLTSGNLTAALYYNSSGNSQVNGTCHMCVKPDDKNNLVMCDDCNKEYHFMCVPPHTPYNPKRRGFHWSCPNCENEQQQSDYGTPSIPTKTGARSSFKNELEDQNDRKLNTNTVTGSNSSFSLPAATSISTNSVSH